MSATFDIWSYDLYRNVKSFGVPAYPYTGREYRPEFFSRSTRAFPYCARSTTMCVPEMTRCPPVAFDFDISLVDCVWDRARACDPPRPSPGPIYTRREPLRTCCSVRGFRRKLGKWRKEALGGSLQAVTKPKPEQQAKEASVP